MTKLPFKANFLKLMPKGFFVFSYWFSIIIKLTEEQFDILINI
jgi:hypothetical protein